MLYRVLLGLGSLGRRMFPVGGVRPISVAGRAVPPQAGFLPG